ncbi:MAG: YidC/Oxa1 family membrane protein insertase, partial [Oscillospiraceae bacterium]|nr:YidC/Oxa1 family membrane protein insertase [Oscillospiraceae bacterium]
MLDLIAIPFGWVMYLIYQLVHSYGLSILLFTIFIKLLTLPNTYQMQVNQARQGLLAPKLLKIKKSFATNMQRQQEETQKLYKEEGINQTAGCLSGILMMFLLVGVYRVVMQPLTFILRYSSVDLENAKTLLINWATNNDLINSIQEQL